MARDETVSLRHLHKNTITDTHPAQLLFAQHAPEHTQYYPIDTQTHKMKKQSSFLC